MPVENRYDEVLNSFKNEMQQFVNEGFRVSDCFPFLLQGLTESSGLSSADGKQLQQELLDWTRKIL